MTVTSAAVPLHEVRSIVVFRALVLGDLLCATPALRALRAGFPTAHIALVGLEAVRSLVERLASVDEFIAFPGHPELPEIDCDLPALEQMLARIQARRFDLALQLHGSGGIVNPLVASFGARHSAGFAAPGVWRPQADAGRYLGWPETGHEIERLLALTDHLGLPRCGTGLDFSLRAADRIAMHKLLASVDGTGANGVALGKYVCVHPGAQLPSRRWEPSRFATVADTLVERGFDVVLTGTAAESRLVGEVEAAMCQPCLNLAGRTSLWTLGALIEGARWLVCNDTGVSHIAAALGRSSIVVSCGADVARWAPLDATRHTVLWQPLPCRPCSHRICPFDHECANAIGPARVLSHLGAALAGQARPDVGRSR